MVTTLAALCIATAFCIAYTALIMLGQYLWAPCAFEVKRYRK